MSSETRLPRRGARRARSRAAAGRGHPGPRLREDDPVASTITVPELAKRLGVPRTSSSRRLVAAGYFSTTAKVDAQARRGRHRGVDVRLHRRARRGRPTREEVGREEEALSVRDELEA